MAGNEALQGAHQEAQKSTSTTLPAVAGSSPPERLTRPAEPSAGNASPALTAARADDATLSVSVVNSANAKRETELRSDIVEKSPGLRASALRDDEPFGARRGLNELHAPLQPEREGGG